MRDLHTLLSIICREKRQKCTEDTAYKINDPINQTDLIDAYETLPSTIICLFVFPNTEGIVTKMDHILGYRASFKIEIIQNE